MNTKEKELYRQLANIADAFVDLKPEHSLYHSIRMDLKSILKKLKSKKYCKDYPKTTGTECCGGKFFNLDKD